MTRAASIQTERCGFCVKGVYYPPPKGPAAERDGAPAGQVCPYCDGTGEVQ